MATTTDTFSTGNLNVPTTFITEGTSGDDQNFHFEASTTDTFSTRNLHVPTTYMYITEGTSGDDRSFHFEDYTQRVIIASVVCLVSLFGLIGNSFTIVAVILSKKLQTKTNVFVINLAVVDLVTCLCAPFSAVALLSKDGWPLPEIVCSLSAAIGYMCIACSITTLAAIAINRYILITKPLHTFQTVYTPKRIAMMLFLTWLYPILVCSLPFIGFGKWGYSMKYKTCSQDTSHKTSDYFSLVGSLLIYPIPLIILFVCYFKIYRHIIHHTKRMKKGNVELTLSESSSCPNTGSTQQLKRPCSTMMESINKRQVDITKNLFLVMCAFIACLAPFAIALTIPPSDPVIPWTGMVIIFNSMVNPIIYGLKHPHFKEVFRQMLRCQCHMIAEPSSVLRRMRTQ